MALTVLSQPSRALAGVAVQHYTQYFSLIKYVGRLDARAKQNLMYIGSTINKSRSFGIMLINLSAPPLATWQCTVASRISANKQKRKSAKFTEKNARD